MPTPQESPNFMPSADENYADEKKKLVKQAVERLGTIFSDTYEVVFHDTSSIALEESRTIDSWKERGWSYIGFFRKYDGVRFQDGSMMNWNKHTEDLRVFSTEFEDWIMNRCKEAGRENAEYCTVLRRDQ